MKISTKSFYVIFLAFMIIIPNTAFAASDLKLVDIYNYSWDLKVKKDDSKATYYSGTMTASGISYAATGIYTKANHNLILSSQIYLPFTYSVNWELTSGSGSWINLFHTPSYGTVTVYVGSVYNTKISANKSGKTKQTPFKTSSSGPKPGQYGESRIYGPGG